MTAGQWRRATPDEFRYQWAEDVACIDCACGAGEILLSETLPRTCRGCGKTYRYLCRIEVQEPDEDRP